MELFSLSVVGYRRFARRATLRTSGKIVSLVGPNEAGKSTLLTAATRLNDEDPIENAEITRGMSQKECAIEARFLLSNSELKDAGLSAPRKFLVQKKADGILRYGFEPSAPKRDCSGRDLLRKQLLSLQKDDYIREEAEVESPGFWDESGKLLRTISESGEDLSPDQIKNLGTLKSQIELFISASPQTKKIVELISGLVKSESVENPHWKAVHSLVDNVPEFLLFDEQQRDLRSDYSISELSSDVPTALNNLLHMAGIEISALLETINSGDDARIATFEHGANAALTAKFQADWKQSGVSVAIRFNGSVLRIQTVNEMHEFTALEERSQGLRQFVALQSFIHKNKSEDVVLLIDEAETGLHYDAQSDLIYILTQQMVVGKVIYSTHSAGCLPEDLGRGVKLIAVDPSNLARSKIINKFWSSDQNGFVPLLLGLGATTLAFFPTRRAVMVEGASDLLLLPLLLRAASGEAELGFQVIPGLSSQGPALAPIASRSSKHVLYLADSDGGGDELVKLLEKSGISKDRIFRVGTTDKKAVELEDFIRADVLVDAANSVAKIYELAGTELADTDVLSDPRMEQLERQFAKSFGKKLLKVDLAYEVLAIHDRDPSRKILDGRRIPTLRKLHKCLLEALDN